MADLLDVRSLSFVSGIIGLILCLFMYHVYRSRRTYPGFRQWTLASFLNFLGMVLLSLRGHLPDALTIVAANAFVILHFVLITTGLAAYVNAPKRRWLDAMPILVQLPAFVVFTYLTPNVSARIVVISALMGYLSARCCLLSCRNAATVGCESNRFLAVAFGANAIWGVARIVLTLLYDSQVRDFMAPSVVQGVAVVLYCAASVAFCLGLLALNAQRVEHELLASLREVRILEGMLPICSSCKKIRDDEGVWRHLEIYISNHSEAEFTHGICPECQEKHYGKFRGQGGGSTGVQ